MSVMRPDLIMKSIIPVVMAGMFFVSVFSSIRFEVILNVAIPLLDLEHHLIFIDLAQVLLPFTDSSCPC
jgi:hypothetical protein